MSRLVARPVFLDQSGIRALVFQWGGRGGVVVSLTLLVAVGLTLGTHISLPGLDQLRSSDAIHRLFRTNHPDAGASPTTGMVRPLTTDAGISATANIEESSVRVSRTAAGPASASDRRATTPLKSAGPSLPPGKTAPPAPTTTAAPTLIKRPVAAGAERSNARKPRNAKAASPGNANTQGNPAVRTTQTKSAAQSSADKKPSSRASASGKSDSKARPAGKRGARGTP
jgi:hypothetical protein